MSTAITPPNKPSGLTWGKALKGVALVATVAVVGVAAFYAVGLLTGAAAGTIAAGGTADAIAATAVQGLTASAHAVVGLAGSISQFAASTWAAIPGFFGITGSSLAAPAVAANASAIGTAAQWLGGGAATAVAAHAVAPHLKATLAAHTDVSTHTDASAAVLSQMKTGAAMHHDTTHTAADMAKHAGDHGSHAHKNGQKLSPGEVPRRGWRDLFTSQQPNTQPLAPGEQPRGWSHKFTPAQTAASTPSASRAHTPRDPNFAAQLDADRAHLRDILNEGGRA